MVAELQNLCKISVVVSVINNAAAIAAIKGSALTNPGSWGIFEPPAALFFDTRPYY